MKTTSRGGKNSPAKHNLPPLDKELFHELLDILYYGIFEENWTAVARVLDTSVPTVKRWFVNPPKQRWWNYILERTIRELVAHMREHPKKRMRRKARKITDQLSRYTNLRTLQAYVETDEVENAGSVRHLLMTVNEAPGQTISTADLRKPAHSGGYSLRTLRRAAQHLGLEIDTEGFGEDKLTYYSMPRETPE